MVSIEGALRVIAGNLFGLGLVGCDLDFNFGGLGGSGFLFLRRFAAAGRFRSSRILCLGLRVLKVGLAGSSRRGRRFIGGLYIVDVVLELGNELLGFVDLLAPRKVFS